MKSLSKFIAVDLGAESGRVMLGTLARGRLALAECRRFDNRPLEHDGSLRWDFPRLIGEIKTGIAQAARAAGGAISGLAVDSWGVDFGLLGSDGRLLELPYHYRDGRTEGMPEKAFELMPRREMYMATGIQLMQINSVFQLLAMKLGRPAGLSGAHKMLMIADLVAYELCGRAFAEYSLASTSGLMDMRTGGWAEAVFERLGLPGAIVPELIQPGTPVGTLKPGLAAGLGCPAFPVIAAGSHDTASAVAAVPAAADRGAWAYLSSGTWSLMGLELDRPVIDDASYDRQFTNEGGVNGTIRLLKNIMGLWPVQECRREWQSQGAGHSYAELADLAARARPFAAHIDPDQPEFLAPGGMPAKLQAYLRRSGQAELADKGQLVRTILEGLALKYRGVLEKLEGLSGRRIETLHVVGGGIQNELLCQFTADAVGRPVVAGPVEATAAGNVLLQALATGALGSLVEGRTLVARSFGLKRYLPRAAAAWDRRYRELYRT